MICTDTNDKKTIMSDKNNILYLFDRPSEPLFIAKGEDNVSFDVPTDYWVSLSIIYEYITTTFNESVYDKIKSIIHYSFLM